MDELSVYKRALAEAADALQAIGDHFDDQDGTIPHGDKPSDCANALVNYAVGRMADMRQVFVDAGLAEWYTLPSTGSMRFFRMKNAA